MKINYLLLIIPALYFSCTKEGDFNEDKIKLESSLYKLPVNEYTVAVLKASNSGNDITDKCEFYVNDERLENNIFKPLTTGNYIIQCVYKNLKSNTIQIEVVESLNKKVLIELFTSRVCGFCPWIGIRLDSLHNANQKVISYSIHGQDELEINGTHDLQQYLQVFERPSVRIDRGYVRDFAAPIEMGRLLDSVRHFLSVQPPLEISIQSNLKQDNLSVKVFCKYYEKILDDLYVTVLLVEDGVITQNQYNYFSGYPNPSHGGPFISLPNLLPDYENHNVLRKFLTNPLGDKINKVDFFNIAPQQVATFEIAIGNDIDPANSYIIAIIHKRRDNIEASSVLNSQIVKVGESVDLSN
jgi:hypothetical protein